MKILVCVSHVPDTTTKISFSNENKELNTAGVQFIMNPYDEWYALVKALEIKETLGATVTMINVGKAECEATIRKGLAIGGDDAVRIDADSSDASFVAKEIAAYAKAENYDLILSGKETINYNGASVGCMIAEVLNFPFISLATKLTLAGTTATIEHDIDGGTEIVECQLPFVLSAQKGMAEARIPNMRGIMAARTKPLKVIPPTTTDKLTAVVSYELTAGRTTCKMINPDNAEELIDLLHNTSKVI